MRIESRQTIHAGVNFIYSPIPPLDKGSFLAFQQELDDLGIAISNIEYRDRGLVAIRRPKMPLEITVDLVFPQVGQLLIVAPFPERPLDTVEAEAEDIVRIFDKIWPDERRRILAADATIRDLYETNSKHAFQELWEIRLGQSRQSLAKLGPGLLGGGFRFVLPPSKDAQHTTEVKIESFLTDSKKLFIEVQFKWTGLLGTTFDPTDRLELLNDYITKQVVEFVMEGKTS